MNLKNSCLVSVAALIIGYAIAAVATAQAIGPLTSTFGIYSYDDSSCNVAVDPIGVVFLNGSGAYNHPYQHASRSDHGMWSYGGSNPGQFFWDDTGCTSGDWDAANGSGNSSRSHMRWEHAQTTDSGQAYAATPHYEEWVWDFWPTGHHCVRSGGFSTGRNGIQFQWITNGNKHPYNYWSYWGNTFAPLKCDGQYVGGDGNVLYIDMYGI